ncbi:hypothetical protein [Paraburkholderia caffeinilytica]
MDWLQKNNDRFLVDLTADEGRSIEILTELLRAKNGAGEAMAVAKT